MAEKKAVAVKPVTVTKDTEVLLGKASGKIDSSLSNIKDAIIILEDLSGKKDDLSLEIANREAKIAELDTEFKEGQRQNKVNLEVDFKENKEKVVTQFLLDQGLTTIKDTELTGLKNQITKLTVEFDKDVNSKVAASMSAANSTFSSAKALYIAEESAKGAQMKAEVTTLKDKVEFLERQNESLLEQLKEAGLNSVEIAKAGAIGTINWGPEGKR